MTSQCSLLLAPIRQPARGPRCTYFFHLLLKLLRLLRERFQLRQHSAEISSNNRVVFAMRLRRLGGGEPFITDDRTDAVVERRSIIFLPLSGHSIAVEGYLDISQTFLDV